jgi:hypothetical protein
MFYCARVVRGKMGHFVAPSNARIKNSSKIAKICIFYYPMLSVNVSHVLGHGRKQLE